MSEAENVYWLHTTYQNSSTVLSMIITGGLRVKLELTKYISENSSRSLVMGRLLLIRFRSCREGAVGRDFLENGFHPS